MKSKAGFSLVELVIVLAITATTVALFVPTIVAARQETRRAECTNNLRHIGQAWLAHEQAHGFLPSSGWGWRWTGDPDRGFGVKQPGGWAYDLLRFTEHADMANRGAGMEDASKAVGMLQANTTPISFFLCPERREVRTYPVGRNDFLAVNLPECAPGSCFVSRLDYQANSGNIAMGESAGPSGNRRFHEEPVAYAIGRHTGVTHQLSEIRLAQIEDGLSNTICVGEKYLNSTAYLNGSDPADNGSALIGIDRDVNGYTASSTAHDPSRQIRSFQPLRDRPGLSMPWTFGGPHPLGFNVVNCDASVRFVNYDVDYYVFFLMGGRADGP